MSTTGSPIGQTGKQPRPIVKRPVTKSNNKKSNDTLQLERSRPTTTKKPRPKQPVDDPNLNSLRDQLLENPDFSEISDEDLKKLAPYLREQAQQMANKEDYDGAVNNKSLSDKILQELKNRNNNSQTKTRDLSDEVQERLKQFDEKCKDELKEYDETTNQKLADLENIQNEEREKEEQIWANDMPHKYRKPTQQLLQLKQIEKSLASSGEYSRAKEVHQQAEALTQVEAERAQEALIRDYNIAIEKLNQKHQDEIEYIVHNRAHNRDLLIARQETERMAIINRDKVVKQKNSEKKPTKKAVSGQAMYTSGVVSSGECGKVDEVLLPPLRAPNDPEFVEQENKRRKESNRKKMEYQRRNAEQTLKRYSLEPDNESQASESTSSKVSKSTQSPKSPLSPKSPKKSPSSPTSPKASNSLKSPKSTESSSSTSSDDEKEKVEQKVTEETSQDEAIVQDSQSDQKIEEEKVSLAGMGADAAASLIDSDDE